ncbi:MAG: cation-translocating P-type ATPase, partial [Chitinophagia bacterium]|nr:cation-translocating P-type ATPase [Chitinophagia bacterium]
NEPMEAYSMDLPPRRMTQTFLSWGELSLSLWQGLTITAGTLATYQLAVWDSLGEDMTRTLVFTCLVSANIFLTLVNRSFFFSIMDTFAYRNRLLGGIILLTLLLTVSLMAVPAFRTFFGFEWPGWTAMGRATGIGMASVLWFEVVKWRKRRRGVSNERHSQAA